MSFITKLVAVALSTGAAASPLTPIPAGARLDARVSLGNAFAAVVYEQPIVGRPFSSRTLEIRRHGVRVQRFRAVSDALGLLAADITGDGIRDVLSLKYVDGSGGCGTYRLYGGPRLKELWVQQACADDKFVTLEHGALVSWTAVPSSQTRATRGAIHCCWRIWRRTVWRWTGTEIEVRSRTVGPAPHWNHPHVRLFPPLPPPAMYPGSWGP